MNPTGQQAPNGSDGLLPQPGAALPTTIGQKLAGLPGASLAGGGVYAQAHVTYGVLGATVTATLPLQSLPAVVAPGRVAAAA